MSAHLYPGIKSLHLVLDTPYDLIRTNDVRDDIVGVKVWFSTTMGFDPKLSQGTLAFDGLSLSIAIPNLDTNTQYYVRYAFISAIDPDTYTISAEMTETVYDENTSVYGYLTNDPTTIATAADGSGGNYNLTNGTFKVYNLSQDITTGNGVVYGIVAGTVFGGITATISNEGLYSATALTTTAGSVTFYAQYNGITIVKVWNLAKSVAGDSAISLRVNATGDSYLFKDESATSSTSGVIAITTALQHTTGVPTYTAQAFKRDGTYLGATPFTIVGSTITISADQFINNALYTNQVSYVTVTSTLGVISDSITLYRINDGSEQIIVEQSNQAHTIAAFTDGSVLAANYAGSGNIIKVLQGNTYLPIDTSSPYAPGTWRITTINGVGITADTTPTTGYDYVNFDTQASMTTDTAYIDYTITGISSTGKNFVVTVRQSFAKSKAGVAGSSAPIVFLTGTSQTFIVAKNTGTVSPATITMQAVATNMPGATYIWKVDDVVQVGQTGTTFSVASFTGTTPKLIRVDATSGTLTAFDQMSIFSLKEGDDALQAGLLNENQTISCDATGTPIAGQFPIASNLTVVRGSAVLTSGVSYSKVSETGMTSTINASTGVISITSITATSGTTTYRATIGTTTIDKVLNINKSLNGAAGTNGTNGTNGNTGPIVDISGITNFYKNTGGAISPTSATLVAVVQNITSPSYTWAITGGTPSSATGSSVTISPSGSSSLSVTLTVSGSNLTSNIVVTRGMTLVEQGTPGQAGQNGVMSAYPTIYQWATSAPARPTTTSVYTWSTSGYTAPSGWSTIAPSNTTPGYILYEITVPLTVVATTTSSTLDWTSASYAIRATTINGTNGAAGTNGTNGTNGAAGATGATGSDGGAGAPGPGSFLVTRSANDSSQPTYWEVYVALNYLRFAVTGDIVTISYNSGNNSVAYRATSSGSGASWALQTSYITGSLIVQNSISGDRITANSLSVAKITSGSTNINTTNFNGQALTGSFAIGSGDKMPVGNTAAIGAFICGNNAGWALAGINNNTAGGGEWANGVLAATTSPGGAGLGAYSVASQYSYATNLKFCAVMGETGAGGYCLGMKTSSYYQTSYVNNLYQGYRKSMAYFALPDYGLLASCYGESANLSWGAVTDLEVTLAQLAYCSADQSNSFAALFVRRYSTGGYKGAEAGRVVICPSWQPTRAVEASGGSVMYEATIGHFPGGITSFTGVHEAQTNVEITAGDIVIDGEILFKQDIANVFSEVLVSPGPRDKRVYGIAAHYYENKAIPFIPDDTTGGQEAQGYMQQTVEIDAPIDPWKLKYTVLVNGVGEGQVNVCGENGDIEIGDLIVTSSIPGKGMKQDDDIIRSYTVAKARESVTFSSPTEVKMIGCVYHCG